jgi:aminoglycoside phosphotransferase (APT) family kinase protein
MSADATAEAIEAWAREVAGWEATMPAAVVVLDGGYSWQTSRVSCGGDSVIVRVAPMGGTVEPHDPHGEASVLAAAATADIPVPRVLAIDDGGRLGRPAAIHSDLPGESVRPTDDVSDPAPYRSTFARTLGDIHGRMAADDLTITESYVLALHEEMDHYRRTAPCAHPGFEIGWRWLVENLPSDDRPAVRLHGDYRLANLLWTGPGELSAVLDWERSRSGDPMCDIAFSRMFSGWCAIDGDATATYVDAGGSPVDEDRIVYATVFERWRSFTSAMRGLAAYVDGRNPDRRLIRIGLAGEAGAWRLASHLPHIAGWDRTDLPDALYTSAIVDDQRTAWPVLADADARARSRSLEEMRSLEGTSLHALPSDLASADPEVFYAHAHSLAAQAASRGDDVLPFLQALSTRATLRFQLLEEHGWH